MTGSKAQATRRISGLSAAVVAAGAMGAMVATPSSASAATPHQTTFSGNCSIIGHTTSHAMKSFFRGKGLCVGSLNGGRVMAHRVVETIREHGAITPDYFGLPTVYGSGNGVGTLEFRGEVLSFDIQESLASFTIEGASSGIGSGTVVPVSGGEVRLATSTSGLIAG